jgi:hypothetical protein
MQKPLSIPASGDPLRAELGPRRSVASQAAGHPGSGFRDLVRAAGTSGRSSTQSSPYVIQAGDTLSDIARRQLLEQGRPVSGAEIVREVERIARSNAIADPDRIYAGATLELRGGDAPSQGLASGVSSFVTRAFERHYDPAIYRERVARQPGTTPTIATGVSAPQTPSFPQLDRTLDRAVERGFIPADERSAVHNRIVTMGRKFNFSPDDFATVALMESDGLNPKATNGQCHGIIQFCEGPARGAASVGMRGRASEISSLSVLKQLELVDRYFQDTRLGETGAVSLVDLYLTVLTPAARSERRHDVPLDIAGRQAKVLHQDGDRAQPITRGSLLTGLVSHARARLEPLGKIFAPLPAAALLSQQSRERIAVPERVGLEPPSSAATSRGAHARGRQG